MYRRPVVDVVVNLSEIDGRRAIKMRDALETARREACKSVEMFKLGAALVRRNVVVATGRNKNHNSCGLDSIHAEMDATWKLPKTETTDGLHLVVVRVTRNDTLACSKPCAACLRALGRMRIRKITYTTGRDDEVRTIFL